jgi:uncharacterized protein (TIGR03086 family)
MSAGPYEQATGVGRAVLANVTPDQMQMSTPCASWDVAELIDHIVGGQYFFAGCMAGEEASEDQPKFSEGDYLTAFDEGAAKAAAAFSEDGALEKMVTVPFGVFPGSAFMGLAMTDTFQHSWDLARATSQDTNLAPELAQAILEQSAQGIPEDFRGPEGAPFGPIQEAASDAGPADQLAAFLGRTV